MDALTLPDRNKVQALLEKLLEIEQENTKRLVRLETRMVKMMLNAGLDQDGRKKQ